MRTPGILIAFFAAFCLAGFSGWNQNREVAQLPSPFSCRDDVQYFPPGPEFKLAKEAAAMQAAAADERR